MCGIYCHIGTEDLDQNKILSSLHHRGPDSQGSWSKSIGEKTIHLLHTRLAIRDLTPAGHQPMMDKETGNVIIFNGEIYNFLELRQSLQDYGLTFSSQSDTEVLLVGYQCWGVDLLERLDGMFSFILFDAHHQKLLIARDHIGIKPLYYAQTREGGISFSSEVRSLIHSDLVPTEWDEQSIQDYLVYGSVQEPGTIRQAVRAFPPGHYTYIDLRKDSNVFPKPVCYWNIFDIPNQPQSSSDSINKHDEILDQTLNQQVSADVSVGLFLSGGIDSTTLASKISSSPQHQLSTFTFDLKDKDRDESGQAAITAQHLNLKHYISSLSPINLELWLYDSLKAMDQPSCDGTNTYLISRASKECGMKVVLSGCGADELHGGYPHFHSLARLYRTGKYIPGLKAILFPCLKKISRWTKTPIYQERLQLLLKKTHSPIGMLNEIRRYLTPSQIASIYPNATNLTQSRILDKKIEPNPQSELDVETQLSIGEIQGYLCNTLLRDSDWATMANQQELRVPYLGKQYLETVLQIDWSIKRTTKKNKKPLLSHNIPPFLQKSQNKIKKGFELDYAYYLTSPLKECLLESLTYLNQVHKFTLNLDEIEKDLTGQEATKKARRYWALMTLGFYLKHHS